MAAIDQFIQQCSQLAARLGFRHLIIAAQVPQSGELKLVASPGAKEILQPKVFEWYGVPEDVEALKKENESLKEQIASLGGDTAWPE